LGGYHPRIWKRIQGRLTDLGVGLHPGHRAVVSSGFAGDEITSEPVRWSTGQPPASTEAVLWAIGRVQPNTDWLPPELLDERGFVRVTPELRVPGHRGVFAIGDVAATDPLRSSARNRGDALVAYNICAEFAGRRLRTYRAPGRRWGSLVGIQSNGLEVFFPTGHAFRFPSWSVERVVMPWIVRWGMYRGVRENQPLR
jgi:apoptosis-inducing factor 2